jgi:hypothetical protein
MTWRFRHTREQRCFLNEKLAWFFMKEVLGCCFDSILPLAEIEPVSKDRKQLTAREMPFKLSTHTKRIQLVNPQCSMSRRFAKSRPRHAIGQAGARTRNCAMLKSVQQRHQQSGIVLISLVNAQRLPQACAYRIERQCDNHGRVEARICQCGRLLGSESCKRFQIGQTARIKEKPCERSYGHRHRCGDNRQTNLPYQAYGHSPIGGSLADFWQSTTPVSPRTRGASPRNPRLHAAMVNRADNRIYRTEQSETEGRLSKQ